MVSHEEGLQVVKRGFFLLGLITFAEVGVALLGNGHLIEGFRLSKYIMYPLMISLSLYKAYWIVYNFMHMAYEVKGLALSVLLPCLLLVWAVIAFFQEGGSWRERRDQILKKNQAPASTKPVSKPMGQLYTKHLKLNQIT